MDSQWNHKIFSASDADFESLSLEIFRFQYAVNPVYQAYVNALHINADTVRSIMQIPFLPIRFFKTHVVRSAIFEPQAVFESSGTTGSVNSYHYIRDVDVYKESFIRCFEKFYGSVSDWCIIGLLPSYLERGNSSLVHMISELIKLSEHSSGGFYLNDYDRLYTVLKTVEESGQKTLLIGVTFALLDLAERFQIPLKHTIVMETGGMKGRREEMTRMEVHDTLKQAFKLPAIYSEYGMTELLSQAYSASAGIFNCPPWMRVMVRDDEDPLHILIHNNQTSSVLTGAINVIDLANVHSCSFIATDDAGRLYKDGSFEVLGRIDNSDLRGCSLLSVDSVQ